MANESAPNTEKSGAVIGGAAIKLPAEAIVGLGGFGVVVIDGLVQTEEAVGWVKSSFRSPVNRSSKPPF